MQNEVATEVGREYDPADCGDDSRRATTLSVQALTPRRADMRRQVVFTAAALAVAALALCSLALAGKNLSIVGDPVPVGNAVRVRLANPEPVVQKGYLKVHVYLGGQTASVVEAVSVPGSGEATVLVQFPSKVTGIIFVGIIEGPDPIPQ
jgi:hypothetical protein